MNAPNAVRVSWNFMGGIRGHSVSISTVASSHNRNTSSRGRGSQVITTFQSPCRMPRSIGGPMVRISIASTPNVRIPPTENVNSLSSGNVSITRRVSPRCPCQCAWNASGVRKTPEELLASGGMRPLSGSTGDYCGRLDGGTIPLMRMYVMMLP